MENEKCNPCNFIRKCLTPIKKCPCKECLVRVMCREFCYERHLIGAKHLKIDPLTKEQFNQLFGQGGKYHV